MKCRIKNPVMIQQLLRKVRKTKMKEEKSILNPSSLGCLSVRRTRNQPDLSADEQT